MAIDTSLSDNRKSLESVSSQDEHRKSLNTKPMQEITMGAPSRQSPRLVAIAKVQSPVKSSSKNEVNN